MTHTLPAAVLFDMDGTIVDTEPYWLRAERELVGSFGQSWTTQDGFALVGSGLALSAQFLQKRGVDLHEDDIIDRLTARVLQQAMEHIPWRPGAVELLRALNEAQIPTALVTMSMRPLAEHIATSLDFTAFQAIVTGGDVENPKPHPEPYLRAAETLNVQITDCLAIEDSPPGLASATASGAAVVGVPAHVPLTESPTYTLWDTLAGRSIADLTNIFLGRTVTGSVQA
ncbi:MAG: HAD family phosphatase [Terrimesophilobacter sp.]